MLALKLEELITQVQHRQNSQNLCISKFEKHKGTLWVCVKTLKIAVGLLTGLTKVPTNYFQHYSNN